LSDRCTTFLTDLPLSPTKLKLCNRTPLRSRRS
jgi:hypothetical protein